MTKWDFAFPCNVLCRAHFPYRYRNIEFSTDLGHNYSRTGPSQTRYESRENVYRYSFSLIVLGSALAFAQTPSTGKSAVYLDQQNPFTPDFTAALMAKSVPVVVTTDPANARYTVTFTLDRNNGSVFQGITSAINTGAYDPGGFDRATMQVVDNQTKTVTYSYTCKKDRNSSGDPMKSAAECLAKHWKSNLQK